MFQHDLNKQESYKIPTVSEEAIDWLVDEKNIKILALDGPSPDLLFGKFPVHVKILTSNKLIVENIKDPARLPPRGFTFHATPVKFVGGTGVQVRAYAMTHAQEGNGSGNNVLRTTSTRSCFVLVIIAMVISTRLFS